MRGTIGAALFFGFLSACSTPERDLWVVNTSGGAFAIWIDGKEVVPALASANAEDPNAVSRTKVKVGEHVVEARAADGTKIERRITLKEKTFGYLFMPNRDRSLCFYVVGTDYGTSRGSDVVTPLDPMSDVEELPHIVDRAFEPSPASLGVRQGSGAQDHALRMKPCRR